MKIFLFCLVFFVPGFFAHAGNIVPSDSAAGLEIDDSEVYFVCNGCDVEVTDTEVLGLVWGEHVGWINLQPSDGGVFNTRLGVVSGNAWGSVSGWTNFTGVFIDPETGEFSGEAFSQNRGPILFECPGPNCVITTWRPYGCTNPDSSNYDYTATVDDGSCIYVDVPGCTDLDANNFDPDATVDDGSCTFDAPPEDETPPPTDDNNSGGNPSIPGCTDPDANNYNQFADIDNGTCLYDADIPGCTDPDSPLYNPNATVSDPNACIIDSYGCIDPNALNYNPLVTISNNTCIYPGFGGCLDPLALNYNPNAEIEDGSCVYDDPNNGCTDPNAINFNPDAEFNNGTCMYTEDTVDTEGDGNFDISGELLQDQNNDSIPDILEGGEDVIQGFFDTVPGTVGSIGKKINTYAAEKSSTSKIITFGILLGNILQAFAFHQGNIIFSLFTFYRTKRYWGVVYDSITKYPLYPANVTLFDEAGQAIDTAVTDEEGRYNFTVGPGKYFLAAQKNEYQFPSKKLATKSYDEVYSHLYFGGEVVVEKQDDIISRNIPMDSLHFNWNEYLQQKTRVDYSREYWKKTINTIAKILFFLGFLFSIWVFMVSPNLFSFSILSLYIITGSIKILGIFQEISKGYIQDKKGFALSFAVIRVYSEDLKREVKHTIVGPGGHYVALVPKGHYHMTIEQKLADGTYKEIYKTKPFKVRKGYIAKNITIPKIIETQNEEFNTLFNKSVKKIA
jgi:hypothetical protein